MLKLLQTEGMQDNVPKLLLDTLWINGGGTDQPKECPINQVVGKIVGGHIQRRCPVLRTPPKFNHVSRRV